MVLHLWQSMELVWWCCTRERPWRLVARGDSHLGVLPACRIPIRPFGGGCDEASSERRAWYWFGGVVLVSVVASRQSWCFISGGHVLSV